MPLRLSITVSLEQTAFLSLFSTGKYVGHFACGNHPYAVHREIRLKKKKQPLEYSFNKQIADELVTQMKKN